MASSVTPGGRPGSRFLIVNGDDFGFTNGITDGILAAWQNGILTSTTAMINIQGAPERIARAHRAHPELPIGLHLNIVYGRPVLPPEKVSSLVGAHGCFLPLLELAERLHRIPYQELQQECFAQAELMIAAGVQFDHIDCHMGMPAAYMPFLPVVIDLASRYGVPLRNPAPATVYGIFHTPGSARRSAVFRTAAKFVAQRPRLALRLLPHMTPAAFKRQAARLVAEGIPHPDWMVDAFFRTPTVSSLIAIIEQLPPGLSELMCHPGIVDDDLRSTGDGYVEPRAAELAVLQDPQVKDALKRYGVELVDFSILKRAA